MQVRELVTRLGFDADTGAAKGYDGAIKSIRRTAVMATAAMGALSAASTGLLKHFVDASTETLSWSNRLGIATSELQRLQFAANKYSITNEALISGIKELSLRTDEFARGEGGQAGEAFERLGLSAGELNEVAGDTAELFELVRGRIRGIDDIAARQRIANELFGGQAGEQFTEFLGASADEIERLGDRAEQSGAVVPRDVLERAREFSRETGTLVATIGGLGKTVSAGLLPSYRSFVRLTQEWLDANGELIRQRINVYMEQARRGADLLRRGMSFILDIFRRAIGFIGGFEKAIRLAAITMGVLISAKIVMGVIKLAGAMRALGVASLFTGKAMRRIPLVALAVGIAALIDDIWAFAEGNESALGRVIDSWDDFRARVDGFWDKPEREVWSFGEALDKAVIGGIKAAWEGFKFYGNKILEWSEGLTRAVTSVMPKGVQEFFGFNVTGEGGGGDTVRMPESDMGRGGTSTSRNVNVNATVSLGVPDGTPADQQRSLQQQVDELFRDRLDRELQNAVLDFGSVE